MMDNDDNDNNDVMLNKMNSETIYDSSPFFVVGRVFFI